MNPLGLWLGVAIALVTATSSAREPAAARSGTGTFEHCTGNPYAGRAESLRQAMLKAMANPKYSHPAFWAPYALVGEGGR